MNYNSGLDPAPHLQSVASRLEQQRLAHHPARLDSVPDYLLSDVGLPRFHDPTEKARQITVSEALRRF